jgi:uncharacterized protein YbjT (DUF2867 family)
MSSNVIVFGPTGNVGSITARTAHSHGATVYLAMRDPSKDIPDLPKSEEESGRYHRVRADLNDPTTLSEAVKSSGATKAFIYLAQGSRDAMKASLGALKSSGIQFIVFLSSYTIGSAPHYGDLKAVEPSDLIPFIHAKVEQSLEEVFGPDHFVAIRPGGFATNMLRHKDGLIKGEVRMRESNFRFDLITPDDMGEVSGTILAKQNGPEGQRHVYLFGPQVLPGGDAVRAAGKVLGKEVNVVEIDDKEAEQQMKKQHMPEPFIKYMVRKMVEPQQSLEEYRPKYQEGLDNIVKYTGHQSTSWEDWVKANKGRFE